MIMDFVAVFLFFKDLMAVYDSMKNGTDLPKPLAKYEDIRKRAKIANDTKTFLTTKLFPPEVYLQ